MVNSAIHQVYIYAPLQNSELCCNLVLKHTIRCIYSPFGVACKVSLDNTRHTKKCKKKKQLKERNKTGVE